MRTDLSEAKSYLNKQRPNYGKLFIKRYKSVLIFLQQNPFTQVRYKDIHCTPIKGFKYMIHFRVNEIEKTVNIYAVLSTHLNPNQHWL